MALNMMVSRITAPVSSLIGMWDQFQEVTISFERLGDVLDAEPEEPDPTKKLVLPVVTGSIKFDGVTFCYSATSNTNALQNVSFEAAPGQLVAIVGRSGSGKTTLLRLIQGLYPPTDGRVFVDGHDLQYLSLPHLRPQIGVVSQQEYLFKGTVRETIAFNNPDAPIEEIINAAKLAGIDEFIGSLPAGYETILSEAGSNLSGGQRQRLAIARALLAQSRILLLDEPTSFLDAESERKIQDNLSRIRHDRTILVVAHRISTIKDADLILVMDDGALVERGNHGSLMSERGLYYYLTSQQLNV
jgi:ATP-binding cassette subfamily B protein